jgi:DNA primase
VRILQRYTNDIILCFDGDNAGRKASARGFDELIQLGVPFRVAEIPPPEDPDSFLKQAGVKAFLDLLVRAREFFDWYLDYLCQTHDPKTDRGRIAIIAEMGRVLSGRHLVLVDTYTQRSAMRLGVTPDAVRAEFRKLSRSKRPTPEAAEEPAEESPAPQPPPPHEYWLLKLVLRHEDLVGWTALHLDPEWVQHPLVKQIISRRLTMHSQETWLGLPNFLDECESPELQNLITEATAEERAIPNPAQQLADVALRLRNQFLDRRLATSLQRASLPEIAETERDNLLREQRDLRLLKRQPLSPEAGSISGSPATSS